MQRNVLAYATAAVAPPGAAFQREGDYWHLAWGGSVSYVQHSLGMAYLAYLLGTPHTAVHVLDLIGLDGRSGRPMLGFEAQLSLCFDSDCGERLDHQARSEYARRRDELHTILTDTPPRDDQAEALRLELTFLERELGGRLQRSRRTGSLSERTRVNVTRRLREAVRRIAGADTVLASHFDASLQTGVYCRYAPTARNSSSWLL